MIFTDNPRLLFSYRRGDPEALEQIYHAYVDQVGMIIRYGFTVGQKPPTKVPGIQDPAVQCDVMQDVFVRVFSETARRSYDGVSAFRPYLLRIVRNLMIDHFRRERRNRSQGDDLDRRSIALDPVLGGNAPLPPEESLLKADELRQMEATAHFVQTLTPPLSEYYTLRYQQALPQAEVARRMEITRRRARTLESRLHKKLRDTLDSSGLLG